MPLPYPERHSETGAQDSWGLNPLPELVWCLLENLSLTPSSTGTL